MSPQPIFAAIRLGGGLRFSAATKQAIEKSALAARQAKQRAIETAIENSKAAAVEYFHAATTNTGG